MRIQKTFGIAFKSSFLYYYLLLITFRAKVLNQERKIKREEEKVPFQKTPNHSTSLTLLEKELGRLNDLFIESALVIFGQFRQRSY